MNIDFVESSNVIFKVNQISSPEIKYILSLVLSSSMWILSEVWSQYLEYYSIQTSNLAIMENSCLKYLYCEKLFLKLFFFHYNKILSCHISFAMSHVTLIQHSKLFYLIKNVSQQSMLCCFSRKHEKSLLFPSTLQ